MEQKDKKILLELARDSISTYFDNQKPKIDKAKHLNKKQGVFVTITKHGDLRGCIGFPKPTHVLYTAVVEAARSAAFGDPRFPPVLRSEIDKLKIEISVLTVPELVQVQRPEQYLKKIKVGRDGLIINDMGLLLPQVAVEQDWTTKQYLNALCQKAGLPFDAWQDLSNKIHSFQAIVFKEK